VKAYDATTTARRSGRVTWSIERVYAGGPLPRTLAYNTTACQQAPVKEGQRYLYSTSDIDSPDSVDSLAWVVGEEKAIELVGFFYDPVAYPASVRALQTFDDALEAVAPGASRGLPPTNTSKVAGTRSDSALWLAVLLAVVMAFILVQGPGRRKVVSGETTGI